MTHPPPQRPHEGLLIAFEGIDGVGKSTQVQAIAARLQAAGLTCRSTREPTFGPYGQQLRSSARSGRLSPEREFELFILDRTEHVKTLIRPALDAGEIVLTDRYYFSTIAYQSIRGLDPIEIQTRNEEIAPPPDLLLIFDAPVDAALERIRRGRDESPDDFEREDALIRCREVFLGLVERLSYARKLDATLSPEALTDQILAHILDVGSHTQLDLSALQSLAASS